MLPKAEKPQHPVQGARFLVPFKAAEDDFESQCPSEFQPNLARGHLCAGRLFFPWAKAAPEKNLCVADAASNKQQLKDEKDYLQWAKLRPLHPLLPLTAPAAQCWQAPTNDSASCACNQATGRKVNFRRSKKTMRKPKDGFAGSSHNTVSQK